MDDQTLRLLRIRMPVLRFHFHICHVPGRQVFIADALSRTPVGQPSQGDFEFSKKLDTVSFRCVHQVTASESMLERVRAPTAEDAVGQTLVTLIQEGRPERKEALPKSASLDWRHMASVALDDGLIAVNQRLSIPATMRGEVVARLHEDHSGSTRMERLAATAIYWPELADDIAPTTRDCRKCAATNRNRQEP